MKNIFTLLFTFIISVTFAQVTFSGVAPGAVAVGQRFYLKYTVNEKGSELKLPNLDGFRVLSGPNISYSSSTSFVNGQMSSSTSYTYTLVILATKEGKFNFNPASINVDGKTYKSNKIKIDVVKGNAANKNANNSGGNTGQTQTANVSAGDNLFVKVTVDKKSVYVGEQISATVKIYTKYDIRGFQDATYPSWNGFYKQDIPAPDQISLNKENINGQIYYTGVLEKVILQPQKSGELIIDAAKLDVVVLIKSQQRRRSMFDNFFNSGYKQQVVHVESKPIKINVKSLPSAPAGFTGAVGDFKLSSNIDKEVVDVNDAVSLKLKVSGSGNLKLIDNPNIIFPPDFEIFDEAKITDKIKNTSNGSSGSRQFEYVFAPRHSGTYRIPAFNFVYFNPKLKKYKTLSSKAFDITVNKGDGDTTLERSVVTGVSKEDIQYLGKDIRHIKTSDLNLKDKGRYIFGSPLFIFVYIFSLIIFIIMFVLIRKRIEDNANIRLMKNKKAGKMAKKHLKNASNSLKIDNKTQFYEDITKAIFGYISDKLSISTSDLSKDNIRETLVKYSVENNLVDELISIIDICEFERYAPSSKEGRLSEIYKSTETLINELEKEIKKVKM